MQLFHRDRKASSNPKRWSLFIEKPNQTYQQFQDPVSFYAGLQTNGNTAGNRISVLSTASAPAVPRTKNASSNSNSNSKGKSKAKSISKRLSLKLGLNLNLSSHGGGNTPSWWKSSGSQVQDETSAPEDFYNPNIEVDSFEHIENIYNHSTPAVPSKRSSHFYLQRNSNLRTGVVNKRHSIAVSPSSYNYSEKMAASKRRENTMAEFLMMIDPEDSKSHLTSPSPYFQHQDASIDAFLHGFSSDSFEIPPESDGKRPVSPEGKIRSRPLTPSLDDGFDFRSLNITPEPVLGTSNGVSFQVDSPPPYNSWSTEENTKNESGADAEASTSRPTLTEAENAPQRGLLPWYNDVLGNRASFHSLDELQPPSYPSLGVETPERYTWAGDGKDENIWKRFVGNPEDREAVEILKQAEVEAFRSGLSSRRDGIVFSGRSRSNATDDEEERSFVRPRRDTGAWWKGSASQNIGFRHDADEPGPVTRDGPGTGQSAAATIAASESHGEDGEVSIEAAPLNIEDILQESITLDTSEEDDDNLGPLYLPSELGSDSPVGVCGICGTDLHYHDGEASENWYMTLKNHFEVAHGNWAARMPDWFSESPPVLQQVDEPELIAMDLDPILEDITELAQPVQLEEEDEDSIQKPPEPTRDSGADEETLHECPVPACTESFTVFQDLNLHIFQRHGMRGTPLGLSTSKTKSERLQRDKHHSKGFQCPTFACNAWFATYDEREKHASTCHAILSRPCSAGDSISRDTPEVATGILGKGLGADCEIGLDEPFLGRLKCSGDSSQPSLDLLKTSDEVKLSEFQQLWRGFSTSIKMDEDIQLGESSSSAYRDLSVFSASSAAGQKDVAAAKLDHPAEDDKIFGQTMAELLKVVQQTSGSSGLKEAFDIQEWLQNNLKSISPEVTEALISSGSIYNENMIRDADTEILLQKVKGELARIRPRGSKKGKERAVEYQSQAAFSGPGPVIADPKLLEFRSPDAEDASRVKLASMNARFLTAANKAYDKLVAGTLRPNASNEFKEFVASLGSVSNIVDVGMDVVDMILAEEVPRSLKMVYCFLHVAYAISQSESLSPEKSNILEFQAGLSVFRSCLPAVSEIPGMPSERDIFDEIAFVMWEELEFALKWIETWDGNRALNKVGCAVNEVEGLKDFMRNHCETEEGDGAPGMTIDPKLLCLTDVQTPGERKPAPNTLTSWEDAIGCGVFAILVRWLKELKETGVIFAYLCGSLCTSLASSFKKRVKFKDRSALSKSNSQLEFHLQRDVVSHLNSYDYSGVRNVTSSAISLLKRGYISTIREFENHMVNLSRIRRRAQGEFFAFVYAIVWHCNSCATFVPDSLWNACGGPEDDVYSLRYVDQRVRRELCWFSGSRAEEETTVGHVSLPDNFGMPIDELEDVSMGETSPQRTDFCIRTIDNLPVPPTPTKAAVHENSPPYSTASSSSPNNYDSLWGNSPVGLQGSETSFSNPNSTNITPDELYNPIRANAGSFPADYFSYGRPQVPESPVVVRRQPTTVARESKPSKSKKRKYLEGDGATSFPARRRKVVPTTGKRLYCDVPGCEEFASTSSNLSRHKRTKHGTIATREASYHCENSGCDRVFYGPRGKGNLRTHMRKDHGC
ncbi:hypothetical protein TWF730_009278 [Orbilia blumenaviensis]|uniref:C2H2-type domain-containing protein n=1 Tax=Orbilia blumenaviensis TaxID=1796055 RepID=A0AAV9V156_9PEZI